MAPETDVLHSLGDPNWREYLNAVDTIRSCRRARLFFSHVRPDIMGVREDLLLLHSIPDRIVTRELRMPGVVAYLIEPEPKRATEGPGT